MVNILKSPETAGFTKAKAASSGGGSERALPWILFPKFGSFCNTVSPLWGRNPQASCLQVGG